MRLPGTGTSSKEWPMTKLGLYTSLVAIGLAFDCERENGRSATVPAESPADTVAPLAAGTLAAAAGENAAGQSFSYGCGDEYRFVVQMLAGGAAVRLLLPDTTLTLPHVVSASGARYSEGRYTYWSKGDEALLEAPDLSFTGCFSDEGGPAWRLAKARGVRFRAVGQEPGWLLDIQSDGRIDIDTNYGEAAHHFPPADPEVDAGSGRTVHRVETEAHRATVVIEDQPCRDAMSGWPYEATVTLDLDGREYRGCGRWL